MLTSTIIDKALKRLGDASGKRWPRTGMLSHIGSAMRHIGIVRPDLMASVVPVTLAAGVDQAVPATMATFIGGVSSASGAMISNTDMGLLNDALPTWRTMPAGETTDCLYDAKTPRIFRVYPPAVLNAVINVRGVQTVADPVTEADVLALQDDIEEPLIQLVMSYAYQENTGTATTQSKAQTYESAAMQLLGVDRQVRSTTPKQQDDEA